MHHHNHPSHHAHHHPPQPQPPPPHHLPQPPLPYNPFYNNPNQQPFFQNPNQIPFNPFPPPQLPHYPNQQFQHQHQHQHQQYQIPNQNPPPPPPRPQLTLDAIDRAVIKAHKDLLLPTRETITAWKLSQATLQLLQLDYWDSVGYQMQQVPSLYRVMLLEGKVNAFIHCFVEVRKITSLYDLEVEICKNEGVKQFEELQLGPFLRHPLVLHYFSVPSEAKEVHKITSEEIIYYLVKFMDGSKHKDIQVEFFLEFIAKKQSIPDKEQLCIRIQNLRMHVTSIREARKAEDSTLSNCLRMLKQSSKKQTQKIEGSLLPQKKVLDERFDAISERVKSLLPQKKVPDNKFDAISHRVKYFSPIQGSSGNHVRFISSSSEDESDDNDIDNEDAKKDDNAVSSRCKVSSQDTKNSDIVSRCPYPSITEEKKRLGLKTEMDGQSSLASIGFRCDENKSSTSKKRKLDQSADIHYAPEFAKQEMKKVNGLGFQDKDSSKVQRIESHSTRAEFNEFADDTLGKFITTWQEACRVHSVSDVFDKMLRFYKKSDQQRKRVRLIFSSFPYIGILHVAVTSMKCGMWDSLYDSFQVVGEHGGIGSVSASTEPETIDVEPSSGKVALANKVHSSQCGITVEDIVKNVVKYFELNNVNPKEGKSLLEKQIMFLRMLHDCEKWLAKQFSVKEFDSLGHGEFFQFIEEHHSLLPNEISESLSDEMSKKSPLEVSMLQRQLIILLSQAASSLWENDIITKQHINVFLKKQFPLISFQVSGNGPLEEFLKTLKNGVISSSVLFSVSLVRTYYIRHSFMQNEYHSLETPAMEADIEQTTGALGCVSAKDAIQCLLKAPMLSDLLSWSHWDLIFAPSLGPLVEWLLSAHTEDLLCLVTKDGKIIRLDPSATVDEFLEALQKGSSYQAAVTLLSLFSLYGGEKHVPLSLLKCHARRGIELILNDFLDHVREENKMNIEIDGSTQHMLNKKAAPVASRFILDCIGHLPSEFRIFAADILLSGLRSFTKDASIVILHECKQSDERLMLHDIGLSLNILEWITDYHSFNSATTNDQPISSSTKFVSPEVIITVEPAEHNKVSSAVHEELTDVSTKKHDGGSSTILPKDDAYGDASLFIENIRREEFGLDPSVTHAESSMLKKQHARLGRALQCLSQELYSQDSHFLLELVQNADDNLYPEDAEPTLVFIIQNSGILVLNNEVGFTAQNIRALCDVGNSTKKGSRAGYIGQKGIGFKSVFRVTDAPEIHSNGFHVKFDISEGQIGFVLPTVIPPCDIGSYKRLIPAEENQADVCWNTCVMLPFKSKLREGAGMSTVISMFSDLHPSLLLFLHRLRCIKLKNMLDDSCIVMRRESLGNGIVSVSHGKEKLSWFVATEKLQCRVIRPDVQSTEIAVAFTLQESSNGEYRPHLDQQPVFAFLPLRMYGLKFILQGDFVLTSSREEVDGDSAWNQWLLSELPGLFVSAQRSFCALHCFKESPGKAVAAYMSFVPLVGEVHGFFSQLPRMVISKLRVSDCVLFEGQKKEWVLPCRVLRGWNEQARVLLPDNLLHQHLGLGYLDKDIILSDSLAKALGVHEFGPRVLIDVMSSICHTDDGIGSMGLDWIFSWINTLYTTLVHSSGNSPVNAGLDADLSEILRKLPFVPLSDGTYSSVAEGTVWLPCDAFSSGFEGEHDTEAFPCLYAKLRTVSPAFLSAAALNPYSMEETPVDNVTRMLCKIGVQRLSAHELTKVHILPALSDDKVTDREKNLMAEYLSFVLLHLQSGCPRCHKERDDIISELKTKAFILTNHGYKRSAEVAIHFGREFGNPVDMTKLIDAVSSEWHEVEIIYLKHSNSKPLSLGLTKWREFFQELGVTDFVRIVQVEKNMADLSQTILKDMMNNGDLIAPGSVAKDWESPELVNLLTTLSSQNNREKSSYLLEVLDNMWDDYFCTKVTGLCINKSNEDGKQFKSSFIKTIHDIRWISSGIDQSLHHPKHLFYDCEEVRSFLGNFAPYAIPQVGSSTFVSDIGLKTRVTLDDALEMLELWRSSKTPFTASIGQMSKLYAFISEEIGNAMEKIAGEFGSRPSIFMPFANFSRHDDVVSGNFVSTNQVYWHDPTGSVELMREMLLQRGSLDAPSYPLSMILSDFYQGLHDFFVNNCKVHEVPPLRSYAKILLQLSHISSPSQAAKAVFHVLVKWANDLKSGLLEPEDVVYLKDCLLKLENAVLPTVRNKWVSLHPTFGVVCWCDDEELKKQVEHSENIDFLYFGELSLDEKEMVSENISKLMKTLGVPSLSEVITRQAICFGSENVRGTAELINWVLPYAQRYIYKLHPDKYFQLKQSGFEKISHLKIVGVRKLFYQHTIKGCYSPSKVQHECSCLLQDDILYVDQVSDSHSVFLELSRLFFTGNPELHLANFLHMITTMAASGTTDEQIEAFIVNNQKVPELSDQESIWFLSSLFSSPEESRNPPENCASGGERNPLKSKRKHGNPNWPPADWKTAPGSKFPRHNWVGPKLGDHPSAEGSDNKPESIAYEEHLGVPIGVGVDWVTQYDAINAASASVMQEFQTMQDQPLLAGSSDPVNGNAEVLYKPAGEAPVYENLDHMNVTERVQLSFGTHNSYQTDVTGRVGELVAFSYLSEKVRGASVKWVNEAAESGLPYDIIIGDNEETRVYVEVKATRAARKDWFSITTREWQFALERGESFCIAHVVLMGSKNAKVTLYKNPLRLCHQRALQLALLITKD